VLLIFLNHDVGNEIAANW